MSEYFSINELFINLIFPLITAIVPLILTYFLFEPLIGLIKKTWQTLTFNVTYYLRLLEKKNSSPFLYKLLIILLFSIASISFMHSLIFLYISDSECPNWIRQDSSNSLSAFPLALYQAQLFYFVTIGFVILFHLFCQIIWCFFNTYIFFDMLHLISIYNI